MPGPRQARELPRGLAAGRCRKVAILLCQSNILRLSGVNGRESTACAGYGEVKFSSCILGAPATFVMTADFPATESMPADDPLQYLRLNQASVSLLHILPDATSLVLLAFRVEGEGTRPAAH